MTPKKCKIDGQWLEFYRAYVDDNTGLAYVAEALDEHRETKVFGICAKYGISRNSARGAYEALAHGRNLPLA